MHGCLWIPYATPAPALPSATLPYSHLYCYRPMVCTYYFPLCVHYTVHWCMVRSVTLDSQKLRVSEKGLGKAHGRLRSIAISHSTAAH